jgi:hypothetical protein
MYFFPDTAPSASEGAVSTRGDTVTLCVIRPHVSIVGYLVLIMLSLKSLDGRQPVYSRIGIGSCGFWAVREPEDFVIE